jgi:hypothetical protein
VATDFTTIFKAAHAEFKRGLSDQTIKKRLLLAAMQKRGRITFNHDGTQLDWRNRYREHSLDAYVDGQPVVFSRIDPYIQAVLPYRAYDMNTVVTKKEKLATKGKSAIFKLYRQKTKELRDDSRKKFNGKLWGSGANGSDIHGLQSIGTATNTSAAVEGTVTGTYAGISMVLGANGGAAGDPEYDFWTPTNLTWNSSAWDATGSNFDDTAFEAIRYGMIEVAEQNDEEETIDAICLNKVLYRNFLLAYQSKEQIYTSKGGKPGPVTSLGFEAVWFDGVEVTWETDIPTSVGWGINFDRLELCVMDSQLFGGDVEDDIDSKATKMDLDFFGNLKIESPRHFFKLEAV